MNGVVLQVAALSILYVVPRVTTRGVLYSEPVSHAGYSNVPPRHSGRRFHGVSCLLLLLFMTDYRHALSMYNTSCFSTATTITRTLLCVTLCVHCLSFGHLCLFSDVR